MQFKKLDFTGLSYSPKWYDFETGELIPGLGDKPALEIRPYPPELRSVIFRDGGVMIAGNETRNIFMHCLTGMANFTDAKDAPLVLTEKLKEEIFKYDMAGIPAFVLSRSREFADAKGASEKN